MLTLPFFATQAAIVLESEPVAAHATAVPPTPSTSTARTPSIFLLMNTPFRSVIDAPQLAGRRVPVVLGGDPAVDPRPRDLLVRERDGLRVSLLRVVRDLR